MVDPLTLATITSAVSVLGNEFLKGVAGEAGKTVWGKVRDLLGWKSDPPAAEIPAKVASALIDSPDLAQQLMNLLQSSDSGVARAMVGTIEARGGKVVVAQTIVTDHFQM